MKKLVLLILFLGLVGCSAKGNTILSVPQIDSEDCVTECTTNQDEITSFMIEFNRINTQNMLELAPYRYSPLVNLLTTETTYDRESLIRLDAVTENFSMNTLLPYTSFSMLLSMMTDIYQFCEVGVECNHILTYSSLDLVTFDYGFHSAGGYITYTLGESDQETSSVSIRFALDESSLWYEYVEYSYDGEYFKYQVFKDGIYHEYYQNSSDIFHLYYVDTLTGMNLVYSEHNNQSFSKYYNPTNQYSYYKSSDGDLSVRKLDEMETAVLLENTAEGYSLKLNFSLMSGWDQFYYGSSPLASDSRLLLEGEEVFTNYLFSVSNMNLRHMDIFGQLLLDETQLSTFVFPTEFPYSLTSDEILFEMNALSEDQFPYADLGFQQEDIYSTILALRDTFLNE